MTAYESSLHSFICGSCEASLFPKKALSFEARYLALDHAPSIAWSMTYETPANDYHGACLLRVIVIAACVCTETVSVCAVRPGSVAGAPGAEGPPVRLGAEQLKGNPCYCILEQSECLGGRHIYVKWTCSISWNANITLRALIIIYYYYYLL